MKNYKPIFWGQGHFLTPQHLQQQDLFHQTQNQFLWRLSQPSGWGVKKLEIREESLEDNSFEITNCELVTPEGLILKAGSKSNESNALLHPRKFSEFFDASKGSLSVYLAVTAHQQGQDNLSENSKPVPDEQLAKRYYLESGPQEDLFDVEAYKGDVSYIKYCLRLYFGSENIFKTAHKMLDVIKIAELEAASNETGVKLSRHYIPPALQVQGSHTLLDIVKNIRDLLAGRAHEFSGFIRDRGVRATIGSPQDILRTIMLQTLHRYIPILQHIIEQKTHHPEDIYIILRSLIGELAVFSEDYSVLGEQKNSRNSQDPLPPYDHNNLWLCFHKVWQAIRDLVMAMTSGPEESITLEFDGNDIFHNTIKTEFFEQPYSRYYLMIDNQLPGDELWKRIQNIGKISCLEEIEQLKRSAVFGLKIEFLPTPPEELPQRSSRYTYFRIDTQSKQWQSIMEKKNIAVYSDLDPNDTVMKIIRVGGH